MAPRRNILVKVSGDESKNPDFLNWIKLLDTRSYVVLCVGGGTQINQKLAEHGIDPAKPHGPLGRELESFELRQVARDVLELNQRDLEDQLADLGTHVHVDIPVIDFGGVLCHVNGDQLVRTVYLGFDELYVVTTPEREEKKRADFAGLSKVKVISFIPQA